jgi:hypothetical protein
MPGETGPTLDDEGIPDLQGPLPEKELTGDPQEGLMPPGDRAHAEADWGVTDDEQRAGEPLDVRVRHERPDVGETDPVDDVVRDLRLEDVLDEAEEREDADPADFVVLGDEEDLVGAELVGDDLLDDDESEELATALPADPLEGQSAEEAAMHVTDDSNVT